MNICNPFRVSTHKPETLTVSDAHQDLCQLSSNDARKDKWTRRADDMYIPVTVSSARLCLFMQARVHVEDILHFPMVREVEAFII